jgi:hypothetical protein
MSSSISQDGPGSEASAATRQRRRLHRRFPRAISRCTARRSGSPSLARVGNDRRPNAVIIFLANGTYFDIEDALAADAPTGVDGFERGTYTRSGDRSPDDDRRTNGDYGPGADGVAGNHQLGTSSLWPCPAQAKARPPDGSQQPDRRHVGHRRHDARRQFGRRHVRQRHLPGHDGRWTRTIQAWAWHRRGIR